ncbi:12231_t:CDS:2, partial [Entrophospora sp. SA101]
NSIGAYGGSYCVYRALTIAMGALDPNHRPNFQNTEPTVTIGPYQQWGIPEKIVSLDPFGHLTTSMFSELINQGLDIRPTIAITKAHMKLAEIENAVKSETGGMYPELITRPDLKVFLPPIGGLTVYIFGNPNNVHDVTKRLTVRVHDECNGSDVFGSDICTCRPYLIYGMEECVKEAQNGGSGVIVYFRTEGRALGEVTKYLVYNARKHICTCRPYLIYGMEECVKEAQNGGSGVIVYFRKEGRALGEVTKYLVYNARKRATGGDTADNYFLRTENIAGVKDMRFQALMPDVLHWLGIKKIDRMMSIVEIDAKIADGYFSAGKVITKEALTQVKGRGWDDIQH